MEILKSVAEALQRGDDAAVRQGAQEAVEGGLAATSFRASFSVATKRSFHSGRAARAWRT